MFFILIIVTTIYLLILLKIGKLFYKRKQSQFLFFTGFKQLNYWVTALSTHASDMSAWVLMSYPALIYTKGISQISIAFGLLLGMFFNWFFIAYKIRELTNNKTMSLPKLLSKLLNNNLIIRYFSSFLILFFMVIYVSSGLIGLGIIFSNIFFMNYNFAIILVSVVVLIYINYSGMISMSWVDAFQALFLVVIMLLIPIFAFSFKDLKLLISTSSLLKIDYGSFSNFLYHVFLGLSWGLGYFGQPHIMSRFLTLDKNSNIKKAMVVGLLWQFIILMCATLVGVIGSLVCNTMIDNPETLFFIVIMKVFPSVIASIAVISVISAALTTIDVQILTGGSVLVDDMFTEINNKLSRSEKVKFSKFSNIVVVLLASFIAIFSTRSVLDAVKYAWGGLGATLGPVILMTFYFSKYLKPLFVFFGMVASLFSVLYFKNASKSLNSLEPIPPILVGFLLNIFINLIGILVNEWQKRKILVKR